MQLNFRLVIVAVLAIGLLTGCGSTRTGNDGLTLTTTSNLAQLDAELAATYALMFDKRDSLPADYAERFERTLQNILRDVGTFDFPFDSLVDAGMTITTADNGRVRIFYWLHPGTGTYWRIPAIVQARTSPERVLVHNMRSLDTVEGEDGEGFGYWGFENLPTVAYRKIHRLNDSIYLLIGGGQIMGSMPWINASSLRLRADTLNFDVPIFGVDGDTLSSEVYLPLTWYWSQPGDGDILYPSIDYNPMRQELSFPEMVESAGDEVWQSEPTGKTIHLRFNGEYFEPATGR